jgi:hypothetical protein
MPVVSASKIAASATTLGILQPYSGLRFSAGMELPATTLGHRQARLEAVLAASLAAGAGTILLFTAPPGVDVPAHLYRTLLVRHGIHVWDNLWFAGQYPLTSYSLLYYFPAAVLGNERLVFASVVLSAVLFALLVTREWGEAGRWPARVFALLAIGPLFTGSYTYALGLTALLATLVAAQRGWTWLAVPLGALTLGFSPLAFVFLCMVLVASALGRREVTRRGLALGGGLLVAAAIEAATLAVFPSASRYPFRALELGAVLITCALGAALAWRAPRGETMVAFFGLWALVSLAGFLVPSPFGENLTRLRMLAFPLMLLTAALARFRPRVLALVALAFALGYNVVPYIGDVTRADAKTAQPAYWAPPLDFLRANSSPDYRVEVVPTAHHWETYWLPRAGFAIARGWYRQLDLAENPVLYRRTLSAAAYTRWLDRMGVRYVLLADAPLDTEGARTEARLLLSGRSGLLPVFRSRHWHIYKVRSPVPLLTGSDPARITALGHERIAGWTAARGTYRLRVNYTRYWKVVRGEVCIARSPDGMTKVWSAHRGPFTLVLKEGPVRLVRSALGRRPC